MLPSFLGICHVGGGGGCPAYGTVLSTLTDVIYPISEGGASVYWNRTDTNYPTQTCDVNTIADGTCGELQDWPNSTNITYLSYGTVLDTASSTIGANYANTDSSLMDTSGAFWTIDGGTYYKTYYGAYNLISNGSGSSVEIKTSLGYWPVGFLIINIYYSTEVPSGSGNYFANNTGDSYTVDSDQTSVVATPFGSYFANGTFITNDGGTDYYWDGSGGYYS
jgi:hypothetical protein